MARTDTETATMRLDKWLWCARFYKTRAIAVEAISKGHVKVNQASAKPSKEIRAGDIVELKQANIPKTVTVNALATTRCPAPIAQALYTETTESITQREALSEQRRLAPEPATTLTAGRPTKRNRRDLNGLRDWDERWSASEGR
ncbi:MAG: RNA-binding S4 domain-containing protein [Comamonas sp.]